MEKKERQIGKEEVTKRVLKERSPFDLKEFSVSVGVTVDVVKQVIDSLKEQGYTFEKSDNYILRGQNPNEQTIFDARKYLDSTNLHFGLISDTHMSSIKERPDALHAMYDRFQKEGVKLVLHVGDITDGVGVFRGHEFELKHQGQTAQINHVIANYPRREGITTGFITGNHDLRATERGGVDPGVPISQARPDLIYLGQMSAQVKLADNVKMDLLHPAGGSSYALCFDDQTEILTINGWKKFEDVLPGEEVGTLNPQTNAFEWQAPYDYTKQDYEGEMLHFKARSVNLMVTPNHRLWARRYEPSLGRSKNVKHPEKARKWIEDTELEWHFLEAQEIATYKGNVRQKWQMRKSVEKWVGSALGETFEIPYRHPKKYASFPIKHIGSVSTNDVLRLIGWYVTEGHIREGVISICQSKRVSPENHGEITSLFKRLGFNPHVGGRDNKDIRVGSVELAEFLTSQCGSGSRNKYLPMWLKNLPPEKLQIVFDVMVKGDGWNRKPNGWGYKSISPRLLSDFGEIAIKLGYAVNFHKDTCYVSQEQVFPTINKKPDVISYKGKIYCVSVPNGIIMVRRKGKTIWSGNSYKGQRMINNMNPKDIPDVMAHGHYHTSFYMRYRNIDFLQVPSFKDDGQFEKRLGLSSTIGGWLVDAQIGEGGKITRFQPELHTWDNLKR